MRYRPELFRDDYNLDALRQIQPPGQKFEMLVTPRFVSHYGDRPFEPLTASMIRSVSRRKKIFLDVGAHYGFFSLLAASANPKLAITALEPIPENMEILRRNLELNGLSTVTCQTKAASNLSGRAPFSKSSAADNSAFQPHPEIEPLAEIEVETVTLSSLLDVDEHAPLLVKIDTDGHEIAVLEGLEDAIAATRDVTLLVELNPKVQRHAGYEPSDLVGKLEDMGLTAFLIQEKEYRFVPVDRETDIAALIGQADYANLYCRPREEAINLCFVSHSHNLAGAERSLAELVEQLVEYHGAVCNVVIPGEGGLASRLAAAGAGLIQAEYTWWSAPERLTAEEIRARLGDDLVRFLARSLPQIEATRPDLVCTNSIVIPYGAIAAASLRCPHVWNLHEHGYERDGFHLFLQRKQVLQIVEDYSDFIFGATEALLRELFPDLDETECDFLYPHIRPPEPIEPPESTEAALGHRRRPLRLIELASLTAAKQQQTALRALADVVARGHDALLLLKGPQDPDYLASLQRLSESLGISERVTFEDFAADIWTSLAAADVVLISAPAHAFGRTAAEGMLCGKAVIYPRGTNIEEYMTHGATGLGYETGNPQSMAEQIERLIVEPGLRVAMGAEGYRRAREIFRREGFAEKFLHRARQLRPRQAESRPAVPSPLSDALLTGLQRLSRKSLELDQQLEARSRELAAAADLTSARDEELASIKPVLAARDEELASIKPVLAARDEELASIKPVLAAREQEIEQLERSGQLAREEIAALSSQLARLRSSVLGRLALWIVRKR